MGMMRNSPMAVGRPPVQNKQTTGKGFWGDLGDTILGGLDSLTSAALGFISPDLEQNYQDIKGHIKEGNIGGVLGDVGKGFINAVPGVLNVASNFVPEAKPFAEAAQTGANFLNSYFKNPTQENFSDVADNVLIPAIGHAVSAFSKPAGRPASNTQAVTAMMPTFQSSTFEARPPVVQTHTPITNEAVYAPVKYAVSDQPAPMQSAPTQPSFMSAPESGPVGRINYNPVHAAPKPGKRKRNTKDKPHKKNSR